MNQSATIIQITDPHLFTAPDGTLAGVPTWHSLREVTALIEARYPSFDRLVVTGDIAHDEVGTTYEALAAEFGGWLDWCRFIPGNHDQPADIARVFGTPGWPLDQGAGFIEDLAGWRIVGLDSHIPGQTDGEAGQAQLDWLESVLSSHSEVPTAVFVHHPPIAVGTAWLDGMALRDGPALMDVARRHANLRFIGCGHVHQASEHTVGASLVCSTPSTAFQFSPGGDPKLSPDDAPGFRWIELSGDSLRTGVLRASSIRYPPTASG